MGRLVSETLASIGRDVHPGPSVSPDDPQTKAFAEHVEKTERLHGLRHTFGTRMAAAGVPMRTLQEWMGHRDISTTERYADYAPSLHESALMESAWKSESSNSGSNLSESGVI